MRANRFSGRDGFTLVEMMCVIVAASIVTLAATTLMLFGLRANRRTTDSVIEQGNTRILLSAMEKLAMDGSISSVTVGDSWEISGKKNGVESKLFYYSQDDPGTIYTGFGDPLFDDVVSSNIDWNNNVLTISVTTEDGHYSSTVYCRLPVEAAGSTGSENQEDVPGNEESFLPGGSENQGTNTEAARLSFLRVLANQYKLAGGQANNGQILNVDTKQSTGVFYSEWYIGGYASNPGWNEETPWCACYLSWALNGCKSLIDPTSIPREKWYASVDDFYYYFTNGTVEEDGTGHYWLSKNSYQYVKPGDLILFDWNLDKDPSHIGAVLMVDADRVYTIEGNTSNRVGVRSYKLTDPRILGYGVIDWAVSANN